MPTKTFSDPEPPPQPALEWGRSVRSGRTPRDLLLTNLLVLPGLGSILGGDRVGWIQAPLAATGFVLTNVWAVSFAVAWVRTGAFPSEGGSHLWLGVVGVALFVVAWLWAFGTSLRILRQPRSRS